MIILGEGLLDDDLDAVAEVEAWGAGLRRETATLERVPSVGLAMGSLGCHSSERRGSIVGASDLVESTGICYAVQIEVTRAT